MRVHGERKITMDKINFTGADVIVHELPVGAHKQGLARGTLKVAENFHHNGGCFGAEGNVRIDIGKAGARLRRGSWRRRGIARRMRNSIIGFRRWGCRAGSNFGYRAAKRDQLGRGWGRYHPRSAAAEKTQTHYGKDNRCGENSATTHSNPPD